MCLLVPLHVFANLCFRFRMETEDDILKEDLEHVVGTNDPDVYFDNDWGLFSAVLAAYNHHCILKNRE